MGFNQMIVSLLFIGLFSFAIVSLAITFGSENDAAVKLTQDPDFSTFTAEIESDINSFGGNSTASSTAFRDTSIAPGDETSVTGGQFKTMVFTVPKAANTAMKAAYKKLLGTEAGFGVFLTAISAWLVFILASLGWKAWRGNPD